MLFKYQYNKQNTVKITLNLIYIKKRFKASLFLRLVQLQLNNINYIHNTKIIKCEFRT